MSGDNNTTMKPKLTRITIDLGKGAVLSLPFKRHWTLAEWRRMVAYADSCIGDVQPKDAIDAFK